MIIVKMTENKNKFMDLLLLADEQEDMIEKYINSGDLFALYDGDLKSICVVTKNTDSTCELKNIATYEKYQGMGYGTKLIKYILDYYKDHYTSMFVGTGESKITIPFYEKFGFKRSHIIKNFFIDNYGHEMYEDGIQLIDMIYLKKDL